MVQQSENLLLANPADVELFARHELPLTMQHEHQGHIILFDTETGLAKDWRSPWTDSTSDCPIHLQSDGSAICPYLCRHQVGPEVRPAVELFNEWSDNFEKPLWIVDGDDVAEVEGDVSGHVSYQ